MAACQYDTWSRGLARGQGRRTVARKRDLATKRPILPGPLRSDYMFHKHAGYSLLYSPTKCKAVALRTTIPEVVLVRPVL